MLFFHPLDFNDAISSSEVADLEGDTSRRGLDVGTPLGTPTDHRGTKNQWVFLWGKSHENPHIPQVKLEKNI